ncbi:WD40/YVTN/BNR-like repeat-containing protein [Streptomyces sp. 184]|uniref:WD40/YVTN/BNR-like repeat-containing protein n=1 Tax=Streptomyces sp. 184 TaxID=1827526 RepID=UPI003891D0D2
MASVRQPKHVDIQTITVLPGEDNVIEEEIRVRPLHRAITTVATGAALVASLFTAAAPAHAAKHPGHWESPKCARVVSDGSLTHTRDGGATFAPTTTAERPPYYQLVTGLEPLATRNRLLATDINGRVTRSTDSGCRWRTIATLGNGHWFVSPARDGSAYVWELRGERVYRVYGTKVVKMPAFDGERLGGLYGLTAHPRHPGHLRAVTDEGRVLDSRNGGRSFRPVGTPVPLDDVGPHTMFYDAKVSTADLDRIVVGVSDAGGFTSNDGGRTWRRAKLGAAGDKVNGFSMAISPVDPRVVYAKGLNVTELEAGDSGRHLYRSTDGGRTFRAVVDQFQDGEDVVIYNGGWIRPDPTDADVAYFEYGDQWTGTNLYRHDAGSGKLTIRHSGHHGIGALAVSPADPKVLHAGLTSVPGHAPRSGDGA